jgi:hypothetical protein
MENTSNKKIQLVLLVLIGIGILAIVILFLAIQRNQEGVSDVRQVKDPVNGTGQELGEYTKEELEENRGHHVTNLVSVLPFEGTNFSLSYSFDNDEFILYVNPQAEDQGEKELQTFLLENKIKDVSWLPNLKKTTLKP